MGQRSSQTGKFPVQGETLLQSSKVGKQQVKTPDIFLRPLQWVCVPAYSCVSITHIHAHPHTRTLNPITTTLSVFQLLAWHEEGSVWSTVSLLHAWRALHWDNLISLHPQINRLHCTREEPSDRQTEAQWGCSGRPVGQEQRERKSWARPPKSVLSTLPHGLHLHAGLLPS